jgi:hypothetical protein
MTQTVGDIVISAGMDISHLRRNAQEGGGILRRFGDDAEGVGGRLLVMGRHAAAAGAAAAAAIGGVAVAGSNAAREIQNLLRIADTSVERFQEMAFASRSIGIEQDKLADILRDVQDRVGDFLSTGAGPMADFFENIAPAVGVTADQFARLSGPEALQLYVDSLEAANLNQQEMTFYLEAMASDASALLPLLRDGGAALSAYAEEARNAGAVLDAETVARAAAAREEFDQLTAVLSTAAIEIAAELAPALEGVARILAGLVGFLGDAARAVVAFLNPQSDLEIATDNLVAAMGDEIQQSQLLARALGTSNSMSAEAARAALAEAQARHQNVQAIIAERRALALESEDWQTLTSDIADARLALITFGGTRADEPAFGREDSFFSNQERLAVLLQQRQDLLAVDEEMNAQLERTAENIATIEEALANSSGGVVTFGEDLVEPIRPSDREEGGGGGSSPAMRFSEADFEQLRSDFATEREVLEEELEHRLELIEAARQRELDLGIDYDEAELRVRREHLEAMAALDRAQRSATLSGLAGMFGDLSSLMRTENERLFRVGQVAAVAQATIEGYEAAVSAWRHGMRIGGPPMAMAFAGASALKTAVLVSQIASASPSGGGGSPATGGGAPGVAAAPVSTPVAEQQQVNINLQGEFFTRQMVLSLIGGINDAVADGAALTVN